VKIHKAREEATCGMTAVGRYAPSRSFPKGRFAVGLRPALVLGAIFALVMGLTGCRTTHEFDEAEEINRPAETPAYAELASTHNERVGKIEEFWAPTRVRIRWMEEGEEREENGEGNLIFHRPNRVALTFGKVGEIGFWAGCNDEMFWVFEGGDASRVYVARNENAFRPETEPLPIAVHPLEVLDLLGLFELPATTTRPITFDESTASWVIHSPGRWSDRRLYLDVKSLLPRRVELVAPARPDVVLASADLDAYQPLDVGSLSRDDRPLVPTEITVFQPNEAGDVRIEVFRPRDRTSRGPIRPEIFEFDAIANSMRPEKRVILDAAAPNPASP